MGGGLEYRVEPHDSDEKPDPPYVSYGSKYLRSTSRAVDRL